MTRLDHAPEIIGLAGELGVGADTPVEAILAHCRRRVDAWVAAAGGVTSIDALESLVIRRLQMVFEEIKSDADFDRLKEVYARGKGEIVFASLRPTFGEPTSLTYGALIKRRNADADAPDRYVAVIDCRGFKAHRRFFTRWHEIAHRLTTHCDNGATEPVFRAEHDPLERLMDEIAGHVGFYEPFFAPAFQRASEGKPFLTFETVDAVNNDSFPAASFLATLLACVRRTATPVIYLEAAIAHKKAVKQMLRTKSLFGDDPPGELRAVKMIPNDAAHSDGFSIPPNMRVPAVSIIHHLFNDGRQAVEQSQEDLSQWESQGKRLGERAVVVQGRKFADRVIAIAQPLAAK